jgi:hypothetical protein
MAKKRRTTSGPAQKKPWTIMVYMAAAKDGETERAAIEDIKDEMEKADTSKINVVVQLHRRWPKFPQLFRVSKDGSQQIVPDEEMRAVLEAPDADMSTGSAAPLKAFLKWVKSDPASYADHYLLVLWGHTYGLGFGRDHGDPLTLEELKEALAEFKKPGLDILGANTCAMSYAEAAFELRSSAKYLVASQLSMPFAGWPYKEVLNVIAANSKISPAELGAAIAVEFLKSFERDVSMTVLGLGKADLLAPPVKTLAAELKRMIADGPTRDRVVGAFQDTAHGDARPLIDLVDLCRNIKEIGDYRAGDAADKLLKVLNDSGFVVKHAADESLEGLHGVGIFAPGVTGAADLARLDLSKKSYNKLELVKEKGNVWSRLAFTNLFKVLEERQKSVAEFVRSAGATTRDDRTGLTQLVMSLDRAFIKVELALADTKKAVESALDTKPGARVDRETAAPGRFGPPFLRLIGLMPESAPPAVEITSPHTSGVSPRMGILPTNSIARSLAALEGALGNAERTVKRVLTNPRLGLGDNPDVKPGVLGGDNPDVKPGVLGANNPDVKPGVLGADNPDVKPGVLGLAPWLAAPGTTRSAGGPTTLVDMYREVAWSLRMVEESVGKLESVLRTALFTNQVDRTDADFVSQVEVEIRQALREVKDVIENAKHTTRGVVVDPAEGLGPSLLPGRFGAGRQQLALAGGLSSKYLRLL